MADFTQTITNTVRCFGQGPSSKWNEYNWNAFKWGEGTTDIKTDVRHLISESISSSDGFAQKQIFHLLDMQTVTLDGMEVYRSYAFQVSESVGVVGDMSSEGLTDGSGYRYVFPDRTTEGESRSFASWTQMAGASTTWATATAATNTWSEA